MPLLMLLIVAAVFVAGFLIWAAVERAKDRDRQLVKTLTAEQVQFEKRINRLELENAKSERILRRIAYDQSGNSLLEAQIRVDEIDAKEEKELS